MSHTYHAVTSHVRQLQVEYVAYERSVVKLFSFFVPIADDKASSVILVSQYRHL
ncbi:hypothetical protein PISMIDRAFT_682938 [Pisolithus microcarpus 441]|uniref:Uncharacterized protein n=1 Tax=Pisolithus microcarpus 441 TaxID=765257 RepID=A0A0C9Z038_9AGAM|nr:hypothetical protein PISMIDRAFT_682938 [Pisolithus microcarpus 441]